MTDSAKVAGGETGDQREGPRTQPYLYLLKGHVEAEALIEVWVEGVFLDRRLLLLDPLTVLLQNDLDVGIFAKRPKSGIGEVQILNGSVLLTRNQLWSGIRNKNNNCRRKQAHLTTLQRPFSLGSSPP